MSWLILLTAKFGIIFVHGPETVVEGEGLKNRKKIADVNNVFTMYNKSNLNLWN